MKLQRKHHLLLAGLALALAIAAPVVAGAQSATTTVTEPPSAQDQWTREKMRDAKPMPLPSLNTPPVQQPPPHMAPLGPSGGSFGGMGRMGHR